MNALLGIGLLNTLIGLENVDRNARQYEKQWITNAKIDRIYEVLKGMGGYKMVLHKYIERIDSEIAALIEREAETATTAGERDLHYLFENRKHAKELLMEKEHMQSMPLGVAESVHTAKNPY